MVYNMYTVFELFKTAGEYNMEISAAKTKVLAH
jgi:hypothetical protein